MKKIISGILVICILSAFCAFALASSESKTGDQGKDAASKGAVADNSLGDYTVTIDSCRLAKDYQGKDVVIVKYIFENVSNDTATSFMIAINDTVYQNGVGLNKSIFLDDNANYKSDNQMKEIKKGASLEVEVAYDLNDTTTDIEVEVKESFSFDDDTLTKTFSIAS